MWDVVAKAAEAYRFQCFIGWAISRNPFLAEVFSGDETAKLKFARRICGIEDRWNEFIKRNIHACPCCNGKGATTHLAGLDVSAYFDGPEDLLFYK